MGTLERPNDGDELVKSIKAKGWILTNEEVGEISSSLDILSDSGTVASFALDQQEMGEKSFDKRQKKNASEIAAVKGYEVKCSESIEDIPDGTYQIQLRVTEASGEDTILATSNITIANGQAKNKEDLLTYMGIEQEDSELQLHYIYPDKNFAIGLDLDEENPVISGNPEQLMLTGWINATAGTSIGTYIDIDSTVYTADSLSEQGGTVEIIRAPRYLDLMDAQLLGDSVQDTEESGYIITLDLPFLNAGSHTVALSLNVGVPGEEPELVEMKPIQVEIDPTVGRKENAAEQIEKRWAAEFPVPLEAETETEETK